MSMLPTPLIPLPPDPASGQKAATQHDLLSQEDVFATLFSPPTPRASPAPPLNQTDAPAVRFAHTRTPSTSSDFGAFVSVPATDDPLRALGSGSKDGFSPMDGASTNFFGQFAGRAKVANERSKHDVLDELLKADSDPFHMLASLRSSSEPSVSTSQLATPIPSPPVLSPAPTRVTSPAAVPPPEASLLDLPPDALVPERSPPSVSPSISRDPSPDTRQPRHLRRHELQSELNLSPGPSIGSVRSPSLPPPTSRPAPPETQAQRAQGQSFFAPPSLTPARWMSSLLSSAVRPGRTRSVDEDAPRPHAGPQHAPSHSLTMPGGRPSQLFSPASSVDAAITHGTPFAAAPFVPASGAPGFEGDRRWDKGFSDELEKAGPEKRSVRLVGRKEVTNPVLTVELADMLRPHFPALARLPRSWSLLYSLDQHGISLNTLYRRCECHVGGALLIMRDCGDALFGAWMGQGIHPSKGAYYGSGESFLWRLLPDKGLRIYKWTGKNDYVALCEPEYLSFGGGDGHYGLYLDNTLIDGSSARCPTFENEPLCSSGPRQGEDVRFECVGLEVWGVG